MASLFSNILYAFSDRKGNGHYDGPHTSDSKKCGRGIMKYNNGDVYSGEFDNDMKYGSGTYTYSDGSGKL